MSRYEESLIQELTDRYDEKEPFSVEHFIHTSLKHGKVPVEEKGILLCIYIDSYQPRDASLGMIAEGIFHDSTQYLYPVLVDQDAVGDPGRLTHSITVFTNLLVDRMREEPNTLILHSTLIAAPDVVVFSVAEGILPVTYPVVSEVVNGTHSIMHHLDMFPEEIDTPGAPPPLGPDDIEKLSSDIESFLSSHQEG